MKNKIITIVLLLAASGRAHAQEPVNLSLKDCLDQGAVNATAVRNSHLDLEYARSRKSEAFTYYFPEIKASVTGFHLSEPLLTIDARDLLGTSDMAYNLAWQFETFARMNGLSTSYSFIRNGFSAGLSVMQPIYAGGKILNSNRLAAIGIQAAEIKGTAALRDSNIEIEQKYWTIVSLQDKLTTIEAGFNLLDSLQKDIDAAYKAGLAIERNLLEVRQEYNSLKAQRSKLLSGIRLAKMDLLNMTGIPYTVVKMPSEETPPNIDDIVLSDNLPYLQEPSDYYYDPEYALDDMTESKLLELSVKSHELQKKIILADALPQIGIGATYGYGRLIGTPKLSGGIFAGIQIPLSDWGKVTHRMRQEEALIQKAVNDRDYLTGQLILHVRQLWEGVLSSWEILGIAKDEVELKRIILRQVEDDYDAGMTTLTRVIEAQSRLRSAETELLDAEINYNNSVSKYMAMRGI